MATKKTKGGPKAKDARAAKKVGSKAAAAKDATKKTRAATAAAKAKPVKKKAPASAPDKLSTAQMALLAKVGAADAAGYLSAKKAEQRTIDALAARKLVKKGTKDKASGHFHYLLSSAGKKHAGAQPAAPAEAAAPAAAAPAPAPAPAAQPTAPAPVAQAPAPAPTPATP